MPRSADSQLRLAAALADRYQVAGPVCWLGNRCGHLRAAAPRVAVRPANWREPPGVIAKFCARIEDFCSNAGKFVTLARAPRRSRGRFVPRVSNMRSERREGCVAMLGACAQRLDLPSMRVCIPDEHDHRRVRGVYLTELAALAGLSQSRAGRAISDLVHAGMLTRHPVAHQREDGQYEGRATIYRLVTGIFWALGLKSALGRARGKAEPGPELATRRQGRDMLRQAAGRAVGLVLPFRSRRTRDPP